MANFNTAFNLLATSVLALWQISDANLFLEDKRSSKNNPRNHGRRNGKLGKFSSHAPAVDCSRSIDLKLYDDDNDSETLTFQPHKSGCKAGKAFMGSATNGPYEISLVGSKDGSSTFAASVINVETGAVNSIRPDADGVMTTTTYMPEDFPPEGDDDEYEDGGSDHEPVPGIPSRPSSGGGLRGSKNSGPVEPNQRDLQVIQEGNTLRGSKKSSSNKYELNQQQQQRNLNAAKTRLDVLVVWTADAECAVSNMTSGCTRTAQTEANMRDTFLDLAIFETNDAYDNSGINIELNLLHAQYIEYNETSVRNARDELVRDWDGIIDEVHQMRADYGAG